MIRTGLLSLTFSLGLCAMAADKAEAPATPAQPPLEMGEQWTPQDEKNAAQIIQIMRESMTAQTGDEKTMKRAVHAHHHGCVQAYVQMDPKALPEAQRVGVFATNKEYKAWIRFSNGDPQQSKKDSEPDVRGMAVKLMNVPGTPTGTQDFVMMNSKVFFIADTNEYLDFLKATRNTLSLLWFMFRHSETRKILEQAREMPVGNPLHLDYYSATAYKLGNRAMHFAAVSCLDPKQRDKRPASPYSRYLRDRLVGGLARRDVCFNFMVQLDGPTGHMPVENPKYAWDESLYPYVKVGTIRIPKQENIEDKQQMRFCEKLSFDPWHTLPEQRPLGSLNRVRLMAYPELSKFRHDFSKVKEGEPTDFNYKRQ